MPLKGTLPTNIEILQIKECCDNLKKHIEDKSMIWFSRQTNWWADFENSLYFLNDGGHGGVINILYCPFCGKKIETETITQEITDAT